MASSGAAEKPKFHDGKLKPYPHEELGREVGKHVFSGGTLLLLCRIRLVLSFCLSPYCILLVLVTNLL
jgi:hypothetical protein